jgi:class 3 adenylate cyclase
MSCACGHERPERAKFCPECGAAFAPRCTSCGAELTPAAKFCAECGTDVRTLASPTRISARKVVTILFADLAGSTALHERLDPESVRAFMARYYDAMRAAVDAHGGTLVKLLGDGVMCAFGVPRVAEDDAIRAVRAAVGMQESFRVLAGEQRDIGLRVAVNTGEVVVSSDDSDVVGDPVNVAARLQQEAGNGDVVIGESTQRLVAVQVTLAPLGSFALKGRAEKVTAYRVVSLERPAGAAAVAFVGRDDELARITGVYEAAVTTPAARLAVLLGSPGLGKSRLIEEFGRRIAEAATVLTAQCDAAGGPTFAPLAEALRERLCQAGVRVPLPTKEGSPIGRPLSTERETSIAAPPLSFSCHSFLLRP